ncbi:GtrA family protein [Nonomuraea pusilla]|uniref:Putative flippase GtrA (Transmembrane translocase of bactoprenol-linked glucose) n=1 Tax=Nonomuraea pusilla TaxID=46177 RepID=A0A1H7F8E4_9ACTN|nr:GtrA family protein [Nonomuraea pusilla]SEK22349.1 Putative flippase GtrA (transmembrane translocase of bactoprenol-linked glucose) [Nonomuraea pusilla]
MVNDLVNAESRTGRGGHSASVRAWKSALDSVLRRQRITYLAGGAMTVVVYYGLLGLGLLASGGRVPYLLLVVVSHFMTVVTVYPWYRLVVFRVVGQSWVRGCLRFYAIGLVFLGVSLVGLPLLVHFAEMPVMVAQAVIIPFSALASYGINRGWTFRSPADASGPGNISHPAP